MIGKLEPFARNVASEGDRITFWSIFVSGQLALFVIGTAARISLMCLRKGLPEGARVLFGTLSLLMLGFVTWLIGVDPKFTHAPETFVGPTSGYLFVVAQAISIFVIALSKMDPIDAPTVASSQAQSLTDRLEASNPVGKADGSPFNNRIKRLGSATPGRAGEETFSQALVVEAILRHIVRNRVQLIEDRDRGVRGKSWPSISPDEARQLVLRPFFLGKDDLGMAQFSGIILAPYKTSGQGLGPLPDAVTYLVEPMASAR